MDIKRLLIKNYINFRGRSLPSKRKMLVIESDDWGSIRMPSRKTYDTFVKEGLTIDSEIFDKYDSLECADDLSMLFDVLCSVKDYNGKYASFTPYSLVANPDFEKIAACEFSEYHYELVTQTYKRHSHTENTYSLLKEGMDKGIWHPQFHGREHINVNRWMNVCRRNDKKALLAFNNHAFVSAAFPANSYCFPAFDFDSVDELPYISSIIKDGIDKFSRVYGTRPISICPPCGMMHPIVFDTAAQNDIKMLPGQFFEHSPNGGYKKNDFFWGKRFSFDSIHYRRNCKFDPFNPIISDSVSHCLYDIEHAFKWGKPAIIDSHRANYIGSIFPENRDKSLKELGSLLKKVLKIWPDIEFCSIEDVYSEYQK